MTSVRRNGFTLIELLVVVAIIVLLISILLPSLGRARDLAKQASCASNLRQIGIAFQTYMQDHDGRHYPPQWHPSADAYGPQFDPVQVLLFEYVGRNEKVYLCPKNPEPKKEFWPTPVWLSYGYNKGIQMLPAQPLGPVDLPVTSSRAILMSCTMTVAANKKCQDYVLYGAWSNFALDFSVIADWHNGQGNVLFGDSHVDPVKYGDQFVGGAIYDGWMIR